jgi:hypothetical protein
MERTHTFTVWTLLWVRNGLTPKSERSLNKDSLIRKAIKLSIDPWDNEDNYRKKKRDEYHHCGDKECWCKGLTMEEELFEKFHEMPPVISMGLSVHQETHTYEKSVPLDELRESFSDLLDSGKFIIKKNEVVRKKE